MSPAVCMRCGARLVACTCEEPPRDPAYQTLEQERPGFEAFMREYYPDRSLARYGHTYEDAKVRDRWIGWQAKARTAPRIIARRA